MTEDRQTSPDSGQPNNPGLDSAMSKTTGADRAPASEAFGALTDVDAAFVAKAKEFNPYTSGSVTESQTEVPLTDEREPFNDYGKHQNIVLGYRHNRTLSDYPRASRPWVRLYAILTLLLLLGTLVWDFVR